MNVTRFYVDGGGWVDLVESPARPEGDVLCRAADPDAWVVLGAGVDEKAAVLLLLQAGLTLQELA